jgi:predicted MFS family arabinose efflux permease
MSDRVSGALSAYQKFVAVILAFLQFTVVLDFMILSPLGAQLMPALHISAVQFGLLLSTYAFSAGLSGILTAGFADRVDRKKLLLCCYTGLLAGTLLCGLASSYHTLVFGRLIAGLFAGVVGSTSLAIVADVFPLAMRGRVMGITQTAFAASSVLGTPIGLLLSNHWRWNAPFLMIVAVGIPVGVLIKVRLHPVDAHLKWHRDRSPLHHLIQALSNGYYLQGFATTALLSVGGFMLMPFMSAFTVHNIGVPISRLPLVYVLVGSVSVVTGPLIGRASDKHGKFNVFCFGCAVAIPMVVLYTHLTVTPLWIFICVLAVLQVSIFLRNISASALMSALPVPTDRGAYMSISSSLQQMAGGVGAVLSGLMVIQQEDGLLLHLDRVGYVLVGTTLLTLLIVYFINRKIVAAELAATRSPRDIGASSPGLSRSN